MKTLIIPDLHHHIENAERWLSTQQFDRVVFLGDYFDDFGDNVSDARKTATWLRRRIETTQDIFLLGNHDAPYMFPDNPQLYCPGFTKAKAAGINEILAPEHWKRFQLAHREQGWLMSHAGLHPNMLPSEGLDGLEQRCHLSLDRASQGKSDPLLAWGMDRLGPEIVSGPLWLDWESLRPITGINQIVGHTPGSKVRKKVTPTSKNYCLDVRNGCAAAILSKGEILILD